MFFINHLRISIFIQSDINIFNLQERTLFIIEPVYFSMTSTAALG